MPSSDLLRQTSPGVVFKMLKASLGQLLPFSLHPVASRDLWTLFAETNLLWLDRDELLFQQGETGQSAYVVDAGALTGHIAYDQNDSVKDFTLESGALLGEISLLAGVPRTATVRASEPTRLIEIPREALAVFLTRRPDFAEVMADLVADRQQSDRDYLQNLAAVDAEAIARSQDSRCVLSYLKGIFTGTQALPQKIVKRARTVARSWAGEKAALSLVQWLAQSDLNTKLFRDDRGEPLLSERELQLLATHSQCVQFEAGDVVFQQGECSPEAYLILHGVAKGRIEYADSDRVKTFSLNEGVLFGEIGLISEMPCTATIFADAPLELLVIPEVAIGLLVERCPQVAHILADLAACCYETARTKIRTLKYFTDFRVGDRLDRDWVLARIRSFETAAPTMP